MQNFYDTWGCILDDRGMPLHGRISFYEANTTELKTIYDVDGNEISNPIYCNVVPTNQVLLDDSDYTIRYERYIGNGNMESDKNEESWFLYKTELYKRGEVISSITSALISVETIEDLKKLKDVKDGQVVTVLGYYKAGDCPERNYIWHSQGNYTPDGGCVIKSSNTTIGGWTMIIPSTYIDVRWYGDFADGTSNPTTQTSNIGQRAAAAAACTMYHKDLYFPGTKTDQKSYYIFDGSNTISVPQNMICDNGVRFIIKENSVGTKIVAKELKKSEKYLFEKPYGAESIGEYELTCDWINISWLDKNIGKPTGARVGYVIDKITAPDEGYDSLDFSDTKIKIERDSIDVENIAFRNCVFIDCNKNINKAVIFDNMEIKQDWFADDFDLTTCSFSMSCKIRLDNFYDADTYVKVKNKQGTHDYGDLGEGTLHNVTLYPGIAENFNGEISLPVNTDGDYEFHNATVLIHNANISKTFNLIDCWVSFGETAQAKNFQLRRGNIWGANGLQVLGQTLLLEDVEVNVPITAAISTCDIKNCKVLSNIVLSGNVEPNIINNIFEGNSMLQFTTTTAELKGNYNNNYFGINSKGLKYLSTVANTIAKAKWLNNHSDMSTNFITVDMTNFYDYDELQKYTYEGNTGENTLQRYPTKTMVWSTTEYERVGVDPQGSNHWCYWTEGVIIPSVGLPIITGAYIKDFSNHHFPIFAIGRISALKLKITFSTQIASTGASDTGLTRKNHYEFSGIRTTFTTDASNLDLSVLNDIIIGNISIVGKNMTMGITTCCVERIVY